MKKPLLGSLLAILPVFSSATELVYQATVISSEPVTVTQISNQKPDWCYSAKPTSFDSLLKWDVGCEQPREIETTVYEIVYEIDGHRFSITSDEPPGQYLPVKLRLDAAHENRLARNHYSR